MQIGYEKQVKRLMEAYAVYDEEALAMQLQKNISNFRVWRSRDHIPRAVLMEVAAATGYSYEWLCFEPNAAKYRVRTPSESDGCKGAHSADQGKDDLLLTEREYNLVLNFRTASDAGKNAVEMMCSATQKTLVKKEGNHMKIIGWIASILIGLFLLGVLLDACSSPATKAAYDKADRINEACEKMMSDAAPGDQRRNVRQACDTMKK